MSSTKVIDYSFLNVSDLSELRLKFELACPEAESKKLKDEDKQAVVGQKKERKTDALSIRASNNAITDLSGLYASVSSILIQPQSLKWIDLSFNDIKRIGEAFTEMTELKVIYLHANKIESLKELKPLRALTNLRSLTLHGNPIEDKKDYRLYVMHLVPSLNQLDFSPITRQDREIAKSFSRALESKIRRARENAV